jgi:HK97 family phage prohead protease
MSLITVDQLRFELKAGRRPGGGVFRIATEDPVADKGSRKIRFCFSDGSVDRMGDTIDPNGWDIRDFNANPVALWAHDSSQPPIGRAGNVVVEGARLMGDIDFIPPETYAFSETIYQMILGKFLNAVSVGFIPLEYSFVENDPDRGWGIDFKRQQLLEISVCPVPANPNALADARAKGIDTRPLIEVYERLLAGDGKAIIPREELIRLREAAKEPKMTKIRLRSDDPTDDPTKTTCGRAKGSACGMTDPSECAVHGKARTDDDPVDPDDEKALVRALRRILGLRRTDDDGGPEGDDPPIAHEDAIRMAHKCLRTSKAFLTEGMVHHAKAVDLLGDVVDALDEDGDAGDGVEPDPEKDPEGAKAAHKKRIKELRALVAAV